MNEMLKEHIFNMLNYSKEVVWCVDVNTYDLLYTNEACFAVWGYTPQEMMQDKNIFFSHLHPEDVDIYKNGVEKALSQGKSHNEFRILHKDGTVKVIKGDAIFIKGNNGLPDTLTGIARDITSERKLTTELASSQKKFYSIADDSPMLMWTSTVADGLNFVNKAWIDFTGKDLAALKGRDWMNLLHPDDYERIKHSRQSFYESPEPFEVECRFRRKDGEYRIILMKGKPQFDADGLCTGFIGTGFDITEIKELHEKLVDSEHRYESIANDSPILMWTADAGKHCTFFNTAWTKFSGLRVDELMDDKWTNLIHNDDKPALVETRNAHYLSQTPFEIECRLKNKNDEYRWIQIKGSPQFNSKNEFIGFIGNGIDITALKKYNTQFRKKNAELKEALEESQRLLRIVNKTKNIIVLSDTEGKITWVNEAFTRITGYTLEEAMGKKPGNLVQGPETDPNTIALLRKAINNGETVKAEILNYSKDGRKYWLDVRIEPIYNTENEVTGFMAIEIDITQRKLDEKVIADTNKRIRQFSFITSHELRHEFAKIMLLLNASKMNDNNTDDLKSYFTELEEPVNKINTIIQQMNEHLLSEATGDYSTTDFNIGEIEEICLVDDDKLINMIHQRIIKKMLPDIQIKVFEHTDEALEYLHIQPSLRRLTFLDLNFPEKTGWHFLDEYTRMELKQPVIILSSSIDNLDREKSRTYNQVIDFFIKPLSMDMLQKVFEKTNK